MGKVQKTKKHKFRRKITRTKRRHLKRPLKNKSRKTQRGGQKRKRNPSQAPPPPSAPPPTVISASAVPVQSTSSFLNIRTNQGFDGPNVYSIAPPKRMISLDPSENLYPPYSAAQDETYVIHAHGSLNKQSPKLNLPQNVKIFSPVSCLGPSLAYNQAQGHINSLTMIGASCPGARGQGERYVLTHYNDIQDMRFEGERSEAAQTSEPIAGIADGEKINFVAGVYKCVGENHFDPRPVFRIAPGTPSFLSQIIQTIVQNTEPGKTINIIISTCLEYN